MQVLSPNSEQARFDIEVTSDQFFPDVIRFQKDGADQWFITFATRDASCFAPMRTMIIENTHEVTYVPPGDPEEDE